MGGVVSSMDKRINLKGFIVAENEEMIMDGWAYVVQLTF
ncbi:hypothetical protein l13_16930 [Neisseria weaveri ATCC 51223]|nr:hypothetical protein l13_16930 [Neisseria weaveri ATCC 51223]